MAADDADQVDVGVGDDAGGVDDLVTGGGQGGGEAGLVGIDVGLAVGGVDHGGEQQLVDDEQGVDFLVDAVGGSGAQHPSGQD
ncbi:hypothetical protein [Micromonospora sp. LZ34]